MQLFILIPKTNNTARPNPIKMAIKFLITMPPYYSLCQSEWFSTEHPDIIILSDDRRFIRFSIYLDVK